MRLTPSLQLPDELERARVAGELVIFAGAGVSIGPPSLLPSFIELARTIGEPKFVCMKADENALDKYLGRVERSGVDVQRRARELLAADRGHTPLHEYLIGVFGAPERVRLITTNFDPHFARAAKSVFPNATLPQYAGPALPPGNNFRGITQLHGALGQDEATLVLTDRDFADAYMAEGWAARFLARAFAGRTVLFVGYSLGDTIMRYLLHAIPRGRWFALWPSSESEQGAEHEIWPVTFGSSTDENPYRDLTDGMRRWQWYAKATPSDHERTISDLIEHGPPASPVEADYLRTRLTTPEGRLVFCTKARSAPWFMWAAAENSLDVLFNTSSLPSEVHQWANWVLANFCDGDAPPLLKFLRGHPLTLHKTFRAALIAHLARCSELPNDTALRQLVAVIASQTDDTVPQRSSVSWLIERLVKHGKHTEALALVRWASRVSLMPQESLSRSFEAETSNESAGSGASTLRALTTRASTAVPATDLRAVVAVKNSTLAAARPFDMIALGEQRIEEAYELLDLARGSSEDLDWLSLGRTSIAPSSQDRVANIEDFLVELVRVPLEQLAGTQPAELLRFADRHQSSPRVLLRRLGLHALCRCTSVSADEVLRRAIREGWPRDYRLRPELYRLLESYFGKASSDAQSAFVSALKDDTWWGDDADEHDERARFGVARKLLRVAPESEVAQEFAADEALAHAEWSEGDPDGFLMRTEVRWGRDNPSPIESATLLSWSAGMAKREILSMLNDVSASDRTHSLLGAVQQASRQSSKWGIALFDITKDGTESELRVADAVLAGMREGGSGESTYEELLSRICEKGWSERLVSSLASVLHHWSNQLPANASPALLDAFIAAADLIFERSNAMPSEVDQEGWTERSLSHPAGLAARIWWHIFDAKNGIEGSFVLAVEEVERVRWMRVLDDNTAAGDFARPILGMALDRLCAGDYPWTADSVLSAFDVSGNSRRASQLWDGRLMQRRVHWTSIDGLRPYLDAMFIRSAELLPARAEELGDFVALLVASYAKTGFTLSSLLLFIQHTTDEGRVCFARMLPRKVDSLQPEERRRLWRDLLGRYFADRKTNMPRPLSADEIAVMLEWVRALPEVELDVLRSLRDIPKRTLPHADGVLLDLKDDVKWIELHSETAVGIICFLAERASVDEWVAEDAITVLELAAKFGAPLTAVVEAAEYLVHLAPTSAPALIERLRSAAE